MINDCFYSYFLRAIAFSRTINIIFIKNKNLFCVFLLSILPALSMASTVRVDEIIFDDQVLVFGSEIKGEYYYPLDNSEYYLGFLHSNHNHFSSKSGPFRVMSTGCVNYHSALWGIEGNKFYLLDLKPCTLEFETKNFTKKVFASWVNGVFIIEHPEISSEISCVSKSTYLIKRQKFYYLSIRAGLVEKSILIKDDVIFRDHAFSRFRLNPERIRC